MLQASAENPIPPSHGAGVPPPSEPAFRFRPTTRVGVVLAVVVSAVAESLTPRLPAKGQARPSINVTQLRDAALDLAVDA